MFIKITARNKSGEFDQIFISVRHIASFYESIEDGVVTHVHHKSGCYYAKETPEEIMQLIKEAQVDLSTQQWLKENNNNASSQRSDNDIDSYDEIRGV